MTWGDIVFLVVVLAVGSFIVSAIAAWWEERKWDKNKKG